MPKIKVLCRNPDDYLRETKNDIHKGEKLWKVEVRGFGPVEGGPIKLLFSSSSLLPFLSLQLGFRGEERERERERQRAQKLVKRLCYTV